MHKIIAFLFTLLLCYSCNSDQLENEQLSSDCEYIHSIGLSLEPMIESVLVSYSFTNNAFSPIDPPPKPELSCEPESVEISISTDGVNFENVVTLEAISGSYLIENLQEFEFITVKVEGGHSALKTVSVVKTVLVGEIQLPDFINNPLPMEDFTLANDADQFIYRTSSDDWYQSSISNPSQGQLIINDVFQTRWNPSDDKKVAGVENTLVQIRPNLNGISSKFLVEYDLNTGAKEILHEIKDHMDYNTNVYNPEQYWIHEFYYSLDSRSIYFISNKENGGSSNFDQEVYDNIWKLDLITKELEVLTDFLPLSFDLVDFVEDPKHEGNFYISGGERDVAVTIDDNTYFTDRVDIHYFNSTDKSITPVFISNEVTEYLSIDPTGENLVFTTKNSGKHELRSFNTSSLKQKQLTFSDEYRPLNKWVHLNWISPSEFMTTVLRNGELKFAIFNIE